MTESATQVDHKKEENGEPNSIPPKTLIAMLQKSWLRFSQLRELETAAALAYYALFSLLPLLLFFIVILSFLLSGGDRGYFFVMRTLYAVLPVSAQFVEKVISEVITQRGSIGVVGAVTLLWAASGYFTILVRGINRAWPMVKLRNVVQNRIIAILMIAVMFSLLLGSLGLTIVSGWLPQWLRISGLAEQNSLWGQWLLRILSIFISFALFAALYRWAPNKRVAWRAVFYGASFAAAAWEIAKAVFALVVSGGWVNYETTYGSLGAVIALLFWVYVTGAIFLLGAYFTAAVDQWLEQRQ